MVDLDPDGLSQHPLERRQVLVRRPDLQLRVAGRMQVEEHVLTAVAHVEPRNDLRVASVQPFGEPQNRREQAHRTAQPGRQARVLRVRFLRRASTMVPRHERDDLDLLRLEAAQVAVLDQIIRMLVVARIADVDTQIVHERRELEPLALPIGQAMHGPRLVEECQCETCHLLRVRRKIVTSFGELDRAAPADVGDHVHLRDLPAISADVIEDEPFAQREVAQGDFLGPERVEDGIEQHGTGNHQIRTPRIESGDREPGLEVARHHLLPEAADLLGRHPQVAQLRRWRATRRGRGRTRSP